MKNWMKGVLALSLAGTGALQAQIAVDSGLPEYAKVEGVSGTLNSIGSDTLNNLMTMWAEGFKAVYPNVVIQIEGKGSTTAPPALVSGAAQLGPMSRPMKAEEKDKFEAKYGYKPTEVKVAIDALAVFVNKDNPLNALSLRQVDSLFSSTYKRGGQPATTWGAVGVKGSLAGRAVSLYGRNSASGTYGFFKEHALNKGDFTVRVKEQPGSSAVVNGVANDLSGVGYSGIGYLTAGVKALSLSEKEGGKMVEPTYENCLNGTYPLNRFLYIYINGKEADKVTVEFLKFIHSKKGQEIVVKDGYFPLTAQMAAKAVKAYAN